MGDFIFVNNNNYIQIDNRYSNYILLDSGTTTVSGLTEQSFTPATQSPIVAIQPSVSGSVNIAYYLTDGTTYSGVVFGTGESDNEFDINYKVFVEKEGNGQETGLSIYGSVDSDDNTMKIENVLSSSTISVGSYANVSSADNYFLFTKKYYNYSINYSDDYMTYKCETLGFKKTGPTQLQFNYVIRYKYSLYGYGGSGSSGSTGGGSSSNDMFLEIQ